MTKLSNDYSVIEQIGAGSFGEVYLAKDEVNNRTVAAKVENRNGKKDSRLRIKNEYKIYKYLHRKKFGSGLPKIYDFIETPDFNIMFMQLLGPSLEDIFNQCGRKFKLSTVGGIAKQIIKLLKKLHALNYLHRDIKPNNFLIGKKYQDRIYIMDYGLSKMYKINGKHIPFRNSKSLIGTARYASINMHMGFEPSRRDDLESVGYMLIYFANGCLPWQGLKKKRDVNSIDAIGDVKMSTSLDVLCNNLPSCFSKYIKYCRDLKFDETPDYDYLTNLFTQIDKNGNLEWIK